MTLYMQPVQDLTIEDRVSRTQFQFTLDTAIGRFICLDTNEPDVPWGILCDARLAWLGRDLVGLAPADWSDTGLAAALPLKCHQSQRAISVKQCNIRPPAIEAF